MVQVVHSQTARSWWWKVEDLELVVLATQLIHWWHHIHLEHLQLNQHKGNYGNLSRKYGNAGGTGVRTTTDGGGGGGGGAGGSGGDSHLNRWIICRWTLEERKGNSRISCTCSSIDPYLHQIALPGQTQSDPQDCLLVVAVVVVLAAMPWWFLVDTGGGGTGAQQIMGDGMVLELMEPVAAEEVVGGSAALPVADGGRY